MTAMTENIELMMPIRAVPYEHQKRAFLFACEIFGVFREEGGGHADGKSNLQPLREGLPEASDRNQ